MGLAVLQLFHLDRKSDFDRLPDALQYAIGKQTLIIQSYGHFYDAYVDDVLHWVRARCRDSLLAGLRINWLAFLIDATEPRDYGCQFYQDHNPCYQKM